MTTDRHSPLEFLWLAEMLDDLTPPTFNVSLAKHNKPKNQPQRALDARIQQVLGTTHEELEHCISRIVTSLEQAIKDCEIIQYTAPRRMRQYYPNRVKQLFFNTHTEIILGDKSQPYFRCIRIEPVNEEQRIEYLKHAIEQRPKLSAALDAIMQAMEQPATTEVRVKMVEPWPVPVEPLDIPDEITEAFDRAKQVIDDHIRDVKAKLTEAYDVSDMP